VHDQISKLRDLDSGIVLATVGIRPNIDPSTGGPNWCRLVFGLYTGFLCSPTVVVEAQTDTKSSAPTNAPEQADGQITRDPAAADKIEQNSPDQRMPKQSGSQLLAEVTPENSLFISAQKFAKFLGLSIVSLDQMQSAYLTRRQAEGVAVFLGSSFLPLLYGLLGASVFLMRQWFGDAPDAILKVGDGGKIFLRLGLGGIAGLAIGWFWVPDATSSLGEITKLSTAPFALAFLAGFSIELLFSLLDRIIGALDPSKPISRTTTRSRRRRRKITVH
jgi:hypothetical protein